MGIKLLFKLLIIATVLAFSSCEEDFCYECTGYDDGVAPLEDLGLICEGDNGSTRDEINDTVYRYEDLGGTCIRQ